MGLRPLDLAAWLEVDEHRDAELALKRQLLANAFDVVVATRPAGHEASLELLDEVRANLALHHPDVATGPSLDEHPVVAASRLVQEDLCVLVRDDEWRLAAACVCFPSRWNLATKIGTTLDQIHDTVPYYDEQLAAPTRSVFDRLGPERSFWRLNWTLIDSSTLHQPTAARRSPEGDLAQWFFRVERQTIRQLPETRAVVFTIHNYVTSAQQMCDVEPDFAALLLHSLDTAPERTLEYKGWHGVADRLRLVLEERGHGRGP